MAFVNLNIPTLKYENWDSQYIKNHHHDCIISECGLVLDETMPYIGSKSRTVYVMFVLW